MASDTADVMAVIVPHNVGPETDRAKLVISQSNEETAQTKAQGPYEKQTRD